jgi:selenocysteine lyase/cysteine desulfurase
MIDSAALRSHYTAFLRPGRVLLTGHSHQAWPDVARDALGECFDAAAAHVDDKWSAAFAVADEVRAGLAAALGGRARDYALDQNTHALVTRFLSALPLRSRPHLVSTAGEFHTLHRQLRRLAEEGVRVTFVEPSPVDTLAARLADAVTDDTAAVLCSSVLFETSSVVPGLGALAAHCRARDVALLVDAYHHFMALPFDRAALGVDAFVLGGGYKYAQWGEGVCFLGVPAGCTLRPAVTGWFADFAHLADRRTDAPVQYGDDGADRFAGATYDPSSHYRARAVQRFFAAQGLDPGSLRRRSLALTARILTWADKLGLDVATPRADDRRGGFVSVRLADAGAATEALARQEIRVDSRGDLLRVGPAPYTTDEEIDQAMEALGQWCR